MTLAQFSEWLAAAPAGTMLDAAAVRATLEQCASVDRAAVPITPPLRMSWRERLWMVPPETRLGLREACEALDRSEKWLRIRLRTGGDGRIPHRKLDGELQFLAGELRDWLNTHEHIISHAADVRPLHARKRA